MNLERTPKPDFSGHGREGWFEMLTRWFPSVTSQSQAHFYTLLTPKGGTDWLWGQLNTNKIISVLCKFSVEIRLRR